MQEKTNKIKTKGIQSFRGIFEHNINGQGRVSLPAGMRAVLKERYQSEQVVLVGFADHIEVYPEQVYQERENKHLGLPDDDPRIFQYLIAEHSNAFPTEIDGNGRILIPPKLRKELGLDKEVVIVGLINRILIYRPDRWQEAYSEAKRRQEENRFLVSRLLGMKSDA